MPCLNCQDENFRLARLAEEREQTILALRKKIKDHRLLVRKWWRDIPVEALGDTALPADCGIEIK